MALVLVVHDRLALTRACVASLVPTREPFALCVVDNGSTDGTEAFFRSGSWPFPVRYHRNAGNLGLIRALNQGARLAREAFVCFLHNDTEARDPRWLGRLRRAVDRGGAALAGVYGARRLRRDGRYAGRGIVDALEGSGGRAGPAVEVAAVDGVCLFLRRFTLEAVGGFDERYGFLHGYDRELSFAVRERGGRCVVVDAGLIHHGAGTRSGEGAPRPQQVDLADRRAAIARFATRWAHRLPADVRSLRERLAARLRAQAPLRRSAPAAGIGDRHDAPAGPGIPGVDPRVRARRAIGERARAMRMDAIRADDHRPAPALGRRHPGDPHGGSVTS